MSDNLEAGPLSLAQAAAMISELDAAEAAPIEETPERPDLDLQTEDNQEDLAQEAEAETDEVEATDDAESDPEQPDNDEAEAAGDDEVFEVTLTINGEKVVKEVSGDELVNGYQRLEDYRSKTADLAREREAIQADVQAAAEQRTQYQQGLQQLQAMMQNYTAKEPDWDKLSSEDPLEYVQKRAEWDKITREKAVIDAEIQSEQEARQRQWLAAEYRKLPQEIPAWADDKVAQEQKKAVAEYGLAEGVDAAVLQNADAVSLKILRKAWLYDQQQQEAPKTLKRIQKVKPLVRAGSPTTKAEGESTQRKKQMARLNKTGKLDDALPLLLRT